MIETNPTDPQQPENPSRDLRYTFLTGHTDEVSKVLEKQHALEFLKVPNDRGLLEVSVRSEDMKKFFSNEVKSKHADVAFVLYYIRQDLANVFSSITLRIATLGKNLSDKIVARVKTTLPNMLSAPLSQLEQVYAVFPQIKKTAQQFQENLLPLDYAPVEEGPSAESQYLSHYRVIRKVLGDAINDITALKNIFAEKTKRTLYFGEEVNEEKSTNYKQWEASADEIVRLASEMLDEKSDPSLPSTPQ